jgi:hypothetical protein
MFLLSNTAQTNGLMVLQPLKVNRLLLVFDTDMIVGWQKILGYKEQIYGEQVMN